MSTSRHEKRARRTRRVIISVIGTVIIAAGVTLAFFPSLTNLYSRHFLATPVQEDISRQLAAGNEEHPAIKPPLEKEVEEEEPPDYPESLLPMNGVLKIPALDLEVSVHYGVELVDLRKGPGFYPQSGYPDVGNVSIAGHRTTYGAWFRHVDKLEEGDQIRLYYNDRIYHYLVDSVFETHTRDWSVIDPAEEPALTLTTCHPPGWATQRLIVRAYLDRSEPVAP